MKQRGPEEDESFLGLQPRTKKRSGAHLGVLAVDPVHDGLVRRVLETALFARRGVVLEPASQTLWAKVISIAKGLMDGLEDIPPLHEDLHAIRRSVAQGWGARGRSTRSKAVEHARGWVATKMGLSDMRAVARRSCSRNRRWSGAEARRAEQFLAPTTIFCSDVSALDRGQE